MQSKEVAVIQQKTRYRLMKAVSIFVAAALCSVSSLARAEEPSERVQSAAKAFKELAADKENGLPINVLNKSVCVVILPNVKKAGLVVGAQYGRGVMNCRSGEKFDGPWGAPIMMRSSGGSFGLQIGAESTDFVVLVMNADGARSVMKGNGKLGTDASIAAGPVGKTAEASTTATMQAQMLSYSRAKGVFGGVSLSGTSLAPDDGDNQKLYGKKVSAEEIFTGKVPAPPSASELTAELEQTSPKILAQEK
jgi:lipid-binding SYLF domain-containing protein